MVYLYGMKLRGFSIGCQPMRGFVMRLDSPSAEFYDILVYDRLLEWREVQAYELEFIRAVNEDITK